MLSDALLTHHASTITLGRAGLEAGAKAAYLADLGLELAERTRRWFNETIVAVHEQATALGGFKDLDMAAEKQTWIHNALAAASNIPAWGEVTVPKRGYKAPYVGAALPTVSEMIDDLLPVSDGRRFGRAVYRVASAVAHANAHGLSVAGLVSADSGGGIQYPAQPLTPAQIATRHTPILGGFYNASLQVAGRMEWDDAPLRRVAESSLKRWLHTAESSDPE